MQPRISIVAEPKSPLSESPMWDPETERLHWIGKYDGYVFSVAPNESLVDVWKMPETIGAVVLREGGGLLMSMERALYEFDPVTGERGKLTEIEVDEAAGEPGRLNDGKVDRDGHLVTGTIDHDLIDQATYDLVGKIKAKASLYSVDRDAGPKRIKDDVGITNGPCFSPDGRTFYHSDSWRFAIHAYDYDPATGELSGERLVADYKEDAGAFGMAQPDGATVDSEGCIWSAAVYSGEVRRYSPDGQLDRRVPLPVWKPTSVAFGGPGLDVLFVTTMANPEGNVPPGTPMDGPLGGSVFAIEGLGVTGIAETAFGSG